MGDTADANDQTGPTKEMSPAPSISSDPSEDMTAKWPTRLPLGFLALLSVIFFQVSGGPFGLEGIVGYAGPLMSIIGLLVGRFIYSLPEALITAELSTAFPENSGYYAWVEHAFGQFWGFQKAWWTGVCNTLDIAVYPTLFVDYLQQLCPLVATSPWKWLVLYGITLGLSFVNWFGDLQGTAWLGHLMMVATLLPFLPFTVLGFQQGDMNHLAMFDASKFTWMRWLSLLLWNLLNWDAAGCVAGEVAQPHTTFPAALGASFVLVTVFEVLPLLAGLGIDGDQANWKAGYFSGLGQKVGGQWLAVCIVIAAGISQLGSFMAALAAQSFQVSGMADRGMMPRAFAAKRIQCIRTASPTWGIVLTVVPALAMQAFSFEKLVDMMMVVHCAAQLLMFGTFIYLRFKAPDLPRPFKVPLADWACVLFLLPACAWMSILLMYPFYYHQDVIYVTWCVGVFASGICTYYALEYLKKRVPSLFAPEAEAELESNVAMKSVMTNSMPVLGPAAVTTPAAYQHDVVELLVIKAALLDGVKNVDP